MKKIVLIWLMFTCFLFASTWKFGYGTSSVTHTAYNETLVKTYSEYQQDGTSGELGLYWSFNRISVGLNLSSSADKFKGNDASGVAFDSEIGYYLFGMSVMYFIEDDYGWYIQADVGATVPNMSLPVSSIDETKYANGTGYMFGVGYKFESILYLSLRSATYGVADDSANSVNFNIGVMW